MTNDVFSASMLLENMDYRGEPVYVIGHQPADADSVCSAIALSHLYQKLGINAKPRIASEIDRETSVILEYLHVPAPKQMDDAAGKQLVLVDHNNFSQAVKGADQARIVGICDHHALSGLSVTEIIPVFIAPLGSTGTVVYTLYRKLGVEIGATDAALIGAAIMSDTNNCRYTNVTGLDREALHTLMEAADIDRDEFNRVRLRGRVDYDGMTPRQILLSDYRKYTAAGRQIGISYARSVGKENHLQMMKLLQEEADEYFPQSGTELFYVMIHDYDTERQDILAVGERAEEIARRALRLNDGEKMTFNRSISRKGDFLPALTWFLEYHDINGLKGVE